MSQPPPVLSGGTAKECQVPDGEVSKDSAARNVRLLVVDDEEQLAEMVSSALRFAGYDVTAVHTGSAGLREVRTGSIDVLILDVNLPDIDGFEVCRQLRHDGHDVPIIFLTARDDPDDLRAGFRGGGDDYLTKPFSLEELGLRIEALMRRQKGSDEQGSRLAVDGLLLDEDAHQVFYDEREIDLSPTEFRLLRYLMLNERRAVSKMQILDYVWDYDFEGDARVVETYISYLRKKLGPEGAKLIRTLRGVGYVLRSASAP